MTFPYTVFNIRVLVAPRNEAFSLTKIPSSSRNASNTVWHGTWAATNKGLYGGRCLLMRA
jgi:hypothetical protein